MTIFRTFKENDLENIFSIRLETAQFDQVDPHSTLEGIPTLGEFKDILTDNNSNPSKDIVLAYEKEILVGYGNIGWWKESDGTYLYLHKGYVLPDWRHKGIGHTILKKLQERIKEIAKENPSDKAMFGTNTSSTNKDELKLITDDGYKIVWSQVEMEFKDFDNLKELSIPEGFEIRKIEPKQYKVIYEINKEIYKGTWGETPPSEEDYKEFLEDNPDPSLWTVAWGKEKIAGFVLSYIAKGRGVVNEVSVLSEFRRKGLALALLTKNLKDIKIRGIDNVRLHTDSEGKAGARQLYEKLGFCSLKEHYRLRKPLS